MKKHIILTAAALSTLMVGCKESDLDIVQKGVDLSQTTETYYQTDEGAMGAITKVYVDTQKNFVMIGDITGYNYGPYMALTNFASDDIYLAGTGSGDCVDERAFHDFRFDDSNIVPYGAYTAFYRSIHKCNLVINNVPGSTTIQKMAIAEARVMRAFDYMNLAIYWGNPPLVLKVLTGDAQPANEDTDPKTAQAKLLNWCVEEIDAAIPDLEERKDQTDAAGTYKITKGFAYAIKGKCYMWLGDYAKAKTALKVVIDSKKYDLLDGTEMTKIMHADGKGSKESVFEFNYKYEEGFTGAQGQVRTGWNAVSTFSWRNEWFKGLSDRVYTGWHWINPTGKFANDLVANDGMDSYRRKAWIVSFDELKKDMTEMKEGWWKEDAKEKSFLKDQILPCCEGWLPYKFNAHPNQGDVSAEVNPQTRNYPIMRYAEVLLLYAEACAQAGGDDGSGLDALNKIQKRAGSKTISSTLTLDAVKKEKQFEMWMEGCRFADLLRWGDYSTLETADFYTPGYDPNAGKIVTEYFDGADYYKKTFGDQLGFKKGKNEWLPFPLQVTTANTALKQNPGW